MKRSLSVFLIFCMALSLLCTVTWADSVTTSPTGYTSPEDVQYVIVGGTVVNWGAREEDCTFLTTYALDYYTGSNTYDSFAAMSGGTGTSDAPSSQLYAALHAMMYDHHTTIQGYQDTRPYYCYTDCVGNDYSLISSFYSGNTVNSTWTGQTYNREHIWPKSKCINTSKADDSADIMMLRATISSENSSRGNSAYGESSGYYDPGESVRGDCARMILYGYVRWGNTSKMWGSSGVMESLDILLQWMEEDPVDTWEMARNDSVQSITGVRNIFVDYPELAWLLFGEEIPDDMTTPSGNAQSGGTATEPTACQHSSTVTKNAAAATCIADGYSGDVCCESCGQKLASGETVPAYGHRYTEWVTILEPTATGDGVQERECDQCGERQTQSIPATGETEPSVTEPPATEPPATEPPATEPPATEPPVTEPPVTEPPVTEPTETEPMETAPAETAPTESVPVQMDPTGSAPAQTDPSAADPQPGTFHWGIVVVIVLCGIAVTVILVIRKKKSVK